MARSSSVSDALVLNCASRFQVIARQSEFWRRHSVCFRSGSLNPGDLFAMPSLRDGHSLVTVTPSLAGYETLPVPIGENWQETMMIPPVVRLVSGDGGIIVHLDKHSKAPGVAALFWEQKEQLKYCYRYVVKEWDTPGSIAEKLASQCSDIRHSGAVLSVSSGNLYGTTAGYGRSSCLLRRQSQRFLMSVWAGENALRASLGTLLNEKLLPQAWLPLLDGNQAQVFYEGEEERDTLQNQELFCRDIRLRIISDHSKAEWSPQYIAGGGYFHTSEEARSFGLKPDDLNADIPFSDLEALARIQEMPQAYRDWVIDCDGTAHHQQE